MVSKLYPKNKTEDGKKGNFGWQTNEREHTHYIRCIIILETTRKGRKELEQINSLPNDNV